MKRALRWIAAAASVCFLASAAHAQSVVIRSYVPNWSYLGSVERGQMKTVLSQSLAIPDSTLEPQINGDVAAEADKSDKSGHVDCTGDCPDYDWQVDATGSFAFTEPSQTRLTVLSATQNRVKVEVRSAGKVHLHIWGEAIGGGIAPNADGTLDIDIPIVVEASAEIAAFPVWAIDNVNVRVVASSSANISGYTGELFTGAAVSGSLVGSTPLGMAMGGPVAIFSTVFVAGEVAIDKIEDVIEDLVVETVAKAADKFTGRIVSRIAPTVQQGNELRNLAMNATIPGVGQSLSQLQSSMGLDLHVRTQKSGANVLVTATARFDGEPRQGSLTGEIRFPKSFCSSTTTFDFGGGDLTVPGALKPANTDLFAGQSCAQLLGGGRLGHGSMPGSAFLGLDPPQGNLPQWDSFSRSFAGVGVLRETSEWYACDFRKTGLPNGVLEVRVGGSVAKRLGGGDEKRFLVVGNQTFDERLAPLAGGVDFGGATGGCEGVGGSVGAFQRPEHMQRPRRAEPDDMMRRGVDARILQQGRQQEGATPTLQQAPRQEQRIEGLQRTPPAVPSSQPTQIRGLGGRRIAAPAMAKPQESNSN